ncbi:MAG: putative Histidine kinase [Candidatus Saccharibacteria bacterium]|nr:putative Histidine kinase [Candidatus Saccharibacteria bacterium]
MLELIIVSLSSVGNLALAVLVVAKNPHKQLNRFFAYFAVTLAFWATLNYISLHPIFFDQLTWIRIVMAVVATMCLFLLLLSNTFPTGVPYYKKLSLFMTLWMSIVFCLALSPWLFTRVDYGSGQPQPVPGFGMVAFIPYLLTTLGLSLYILMRRFARLKGVSREYIRAALIGIIATFTLLLLTNFVFVLAFNNSAFVSISPIFALIFTASFAYGMIRYQLFDIRLIVARFIAYLLLLLFASSLYGFTAVAASFLVVGTTPNFAQIATSTVVVGILILFVQPLHQFFNRITRAIFYQDDYDTKNVLDKLASVLVRSTNTDKLAHSSLSILMEVLKPEYVSLWLLDGTNNEKQRFITLGKGMPDFDELSSTKLLHTVSDIVVLDADEGQSDTIYKKMQAMNISIIARLETHDAVMGYCFFGYKTSGSAYSKRDIDLLRITRDELVVAIQNALRFEQIQDFNNTLQQRIEEATKELRASNTQLQRLDEAKDEFVSMASHQLRTPLTSVKGYISMVLEGDAGRITATQRKLLSEAFTSSERMVHLIGDFLNVSRLQTGKFMLEQRQIDLSKITAQEIDSLQTTAQAHGLKLDFHSPSYFPLLYIDEGKIRQVLMNFIDNAIYYSEEGTTITVKLSIEAGYAVLQVYDTGIGVPKAEQAHLFTKFFRATNARKQRPDGTGVGLFLAKKVVLAHGGTMLFESVEDQGSTFGFRLPIKKLSAVPTKDVDKLDK